MNEYRALMGRMLQGWNTWHAKNMLAHVRLPEGILINLGIKEYRGGYHLREIVKGPLDIVPGLHSYDGSYTELTLTWAYLRLQVQTGLEGEDWVALVTPLAASGGWKEMQNRAALLVVEGGMLWNRPGFWRRENAVLRCEAGTRRVDLYATAAPVEETCVWVSTPYLAVPLAGPVGLSTGRPRTKEEISAILARRRKAEEDRAAVYGALSEVYRAGQTALSWNTIYDSVKNRVITPVARTWCHDGWVLFEWDTYFAAYMFAVDAPELAMANAIAITHEITPEGLVPNFARADGLISRDRSEPPVGAWVCREIYRRYPEKWFLNEVYPNLLRWNRWWWQARRNNGDLLSWGSTPYETVDTGGVNQLRGAVLESGLDNSPMYDGIPFDGKRHVMQLWDVGLNGLYAAECEALADMAGILGRADEAAELSRRAETVRSAIRMELWDERSGLFLNRRADTREFNRRISPTNFYALLARSATPAQAERMMREHFYNPEEFWGEWVLPSITRNDPAFPEQDYWRGRIWGPMNFLTYLGLRQYGCLAQARRDLAEKSKALLLKNWLAGGHVMENYNAVTGDNSGLGPGKGGGDLFYYWGGLLGTIALMEAGHYSEKSNP